MALERSSFKLIPRQDLLAFAEHDPHGTVVWLRGEHDASTVDGLADIMGRAIQFDSADVVIDLSGVEFMGSAAIRVIERTRESLRPRSRSLTVRSPSRCARRVLDLYEAAERLDPRVDATPTSHAHDQTAS